MNIVVLILQIPILLFTITIHEVSHGYVAFLLGDDTAKRAGRLTLNPIPHIDPIGLIMLFIARFGWAKPVPINPYNFKDYKRDTAISAAAGPISNFIMAILLSILFRVITNLSPNLLSYGGTISQLLMYLLVYSIMINLALGLFNLIPIPPMDGSKILGGFLSDDAYARYTAKEMRGAQILMIVILASMIFRLNIIGSVIMPPLNFLLNVLIGIKF